MINQRHITAAVFAAISLFSASAALAGGVSIVGDTARQDAAKPGSKIEGRIILRNSDSAPRDVRVYATDYLSYADGRSLFGEPAGQTSRSNASWITFTPHQLTVPPGDTASVYYTLQVPQDEKLTGSYWSMLMVEPIAAGSLEPPKTEAGKASVGIRTVIRYAIQLITDIADSGKRDLKFSGLKLLAAADKRTMQIDIENTGDRVLRPNVWVELFDEKGVSLGRFGQARPRLYPGCSERTQVDLSQAPKGNYNALLVADNGDQNVFGTQCKLEIH